ncbi:hypothetical protein FOXYSP1_17092 [Fusarium oxysporum f. sp. phaseoli]
MLQRLMASTVQRSKAELKVPQHQDKLTNLNKSSQLFRKEDYETGLWSKLI